ncbi:MAG: SDR family oxidoreductase, partial [Microbacterium sp.]
ADEESVMRAFAEIDATGETVVGAVTAAGINERSAAIDASAELFARLLAVNVTGTFLAAREAARRMRGGGGSIVTVSSTMAFVGSTRNQAPYSATKGAVRALTTALALEWASRGIRVNSVAPTFTDTPMNAPILQDPELSSAVLDSIPLGRFGEPIDIANAVSWLIGTESSFVTGQTIVVDGGYLAQ